ncbi:asparagine synthase (glutamine-hydrolyzing) [Desulfocurvibacter africanus]|uniref:asparagine synthase (glutamine-hydrolyzing) n=1 Tax=Desulfocurvibacter africanus subsp. africanus str. Walvis Bay TaxID=690850 RepID=F3YZG0_DESAF|nr:asparagine synthase (glutamine-hydrolyzing) [Desulfocurvibacter africanus]EGJ51989.1 asparagine synthase (glutamine-hydrolyzing) [Desulfocurvibacter africanus subsp. africanus str. Walvis Bay]
MCGIAGIVAKEAGRYLPALDAMNAAQRHRGPDGEGRHAFAECCLGHVRLSIIDLAGGAQPLFDTRGTSAITFNGEIYGYQALRQELDYPFRTGSDTEVILALYARYGTHMLPRLPGMFSFAIWDDQRKRLFCARDRFGEKPLFYALGKSGEFIFASEIKAILASGLVEPKLNLDGVSHYLAHRHLPANQTIYGTIQALPPGHSLILENGDLTITPYWSLPTTGEPLDMDTAAQRLEDLIRQAVERQLVADVEVGILLSGGLDSSTITAVCSPLKRLRSFSFGFSGSRSELPYARQVAEHFGTVHNEITEEVIDVPKMMLALARIYDEPFADPSAVPTYQLCRFVSQHLKVALSGDGADELLAGYTYWYRHLLRGDASGPAGGKNTFWSKTAERHWQDLLYFTPDEIKGMGLPAVRRPRIGQVTDSLDDALRMDLQGFLPADILVKTDRAAMAHGLELRTPFLDVDLAEFLIQLPWQLKMQGSSDKLLLRKAFENIWPEAIRKRDKQGFGFDVRNWMQRPDMLALRHHFLGNANRKIYALIPRKTLAACLMDTGFKGWIMLILSLWLETSPCSIN